MCLMWYVVLMLHVFYELLVLAFIASEQQYCMIVPFYASCFVYVNSLFESCFYSFYPECLSISYEK